MQSGRGYRAALPRNLMPQFPWNQRTPMRCRLSAEIGWRAVTLVPPDHPRFEMQYDPTTPAHYATRSWNQFGFDFNDELYVYDEDDNGTWGIFYTILDNFGGFIEATWNFAWNYNLAIYWGFSPFPYGPPDDYSAGGDFGALVWGSLVPIVYHDEP